MENQSFPAGPVDLEPDLAPLVCPNCGHEMEPESEPWPEICDLCQSPIDLMAQFAYIRGRDAFIAGQDLLMILSPKMRRKNLTTDIEMEGLRYFIQAYTSLQLAFKGEIAEAQRRLAIEMMAAISLILQQHAAISPMEASYWQSSMKELTMQIECVEVREKIAEIKPGVPGLLPRKRWDMRLKQLEKALVEINRNITSMEKRMRFVERPNARRNKLPSL